MDDLCPDALWGEEVNGAHVKHESAPNFAIIRMKKHHSSHAINAWVSTDPPAFL